MSQWYILTLPAEKYVFAPFTLPHGFDYLKGQLELSASGLLHWQFVVRTSRPQRSSFVRKSFPSAHVETTRSRAAREYVWKEETYVEGSRFEIGKAPLNRSSKQDWDSIWELAKAGEIEQIPSDIRLRTYSTLRRIAKDYAAPVGIERRVVVYYGFTGTGKSKRAWEEAGFGAYPKDPNTKFWDGYNGHQHVVIDEFRGRIDISHLLRWFDRYPVIVENKGGAICFTATTIWLTSNLSPREWYPEVDVATMDALLRRLEVVNIL